MTSRVIGFINFYYTTIKDTDDQKSKQIFEDQSALRTNSN